MKKLGVKFYTKDIVCRKDFVEAGVEAVRNNVFDYMELFAKPDSYDETHQAVADMLQGINVIIHAPHSAYGLDVGNKDLLAQNRKLLESSQKFADLLDSEIIILHAGAGDKEENLAETINQFNKINDSRLAVENLPYYCTATQAILHGTSAAQIKKIMTETKCKFCFDICHAVCAANSFKRDPLHDLMEYQALNPDMYHLCDNFWDSDRDAHMHYGEGNYDFQVIVNDVIADNKPITMETGYGIPVNIDPWRQDERTYHQIQSKGTDGTRCPVAARVAAA